MNAAMMVQSYQSEIADGGSGYQQTQEEHIHLHCTSFISRTMLAHCAPLTRPLSGILGLESVQDKPK